MTVLWIVEKVMFGCKYRVGAAEGSSAAIKVFIV